MKIKSSSIVIFIILAILAIGTYRISRTRIAEKKPAISQIDTLTHPCFMLLSDVHLNTDTKSTKYGDDTGTDLWDNLLTKLKSILKGKNPPEFIIYTGDLPAHYDCAGNCYLPAGKRGDHNKNLIAILNGLRDLVSQNAIPLLYVPGNNDALSGDYYSFSDSEHLNPLELVPEAENPYPALNVSKPGSGIPDMVSDVHPTMGYYAAYPVKGLRVIVLNSVIFGHNYFEVDGVSQAEAGNTEMAWLADQLQDAQAKGEKVYLAMHIPPGTDAYAYDSHKSYTAMWANIPAVENSWLKQFLRLNTRYQHTITGIFYGHTHMDEVRRLYDSTGTKITEIAISCPGVTPQHYNNPGFKLVYFDAATTAPTDFVTYYTTPDTTAWNDHSYSFSDVFHCAAASTVFQCLSRQPLDSVNKEMDAIYTVRHGPAGYDTRPGIEVK